MVINEEQLKLLKKYNVKSYKYTPTLGTQFECEIEFFPSVADDLEKRSKADEDDDARVNPSTGLTKAQTRDLLGMDE